MKLDAGATVELYVYTDTAQSANVEDAQTVFSGTFVSAG